MYDVVKLPQTYGCQVIKYRPLGLGQVPDICNNKLSR